MLLIFLGKCPFLIFLSHLLFLQFIRSKIAKLRIRWVISLFSKSWFRFETMFWFLLWYLWKSLRICFVIHFWIQVLLSMSEKEALHIHQHPKSVHCFVNSMANNLENAYEFTNNLEKVKFVWNHQTSAV
jgi:hypothetical protein